MAEQVLFTINSPKTLKGVAAGYMTFIQYFAPASDSGYNVCPKASAGCKSICLGPNSGRGRFDKTKAARIKKTRHWFEHREEHIAQLHVEIRKGIKKAKRKGLIAAFRLNGTSDIRWENYGIPQAYPDTIFYDYTKLTNRKNIPSNYHLTFSATEDNELDCRLHLHAGVSVAVVWKEAGAMPSSYYGRPVINGDKHDLRFLDPKGVVVGLYAKGSKAKRDTSGMVRA